MQLKRMATAVVLFLAGVGCGGYLFSQSLPRTVLTFRNCQSNCFDTSEIAGLVTSAGILRASLLVPGVTLQSDTCLAIRHPESKSSENVHYVLFPKHDIKNIGTLSPSDSPYVLGCLALAREVITRDNLQSYRLMTNGPALQDIAYLHFHLVEVTPVRR